MPFFLFIMAILSFFKMFFLTSFPLMSRPLKISFILSCFGCVLKPLSYNHRKLFCFNHDDFSSCFYNGNLVFFSGMRFYKSYSNVGFILDYFECVLKLIPYNHLKLFCFNHDAFSSFSSRKYYFIVLYAL